MASPPDSNGGPQPDPTALLDSTVATYNATKCSIVIHDFAAISRSR